MKQPHEYMLWKIKETFEDIETLKTAVWGGVANISSPVIFEKRRRKIKKDLAQIQRYLVQIEKDIDQLAMDDLEE